MCACFQEQGHKTRHGIITGWNIWQKILSEADEGSEASLATQQWWDLRSQPSDHFVRYQWTIINVAPPAVFSHSVWFSWHTAMTLLQECVVFTSTSTLARKHSESTLHKEGFHQRGNQRIMCWRNHVVELQCVGGIVCWRNHALEELCVGRTVW